MKTKRIFQKQKNGFVILLLDFLFIAGGIFLLLYSLLKDQEIGVSIFGTIFGK